MTSASYSGTAFYELPGGENLPWWRKGFVVSLVVVLHLLTLILAFGAVMRPEIRESVITMTARVFEVAPVPPRSEPPKPLPMDNLKPRRVVVAPQQLMTASQQSVATSSFMVDVQPPIPPVNSVSAAPRQSVATVAARFDADYLRNPKPAYPPMARRFGEEGKVILRVRVSAQGLPLSVEIKQSSGFQRLDEAALAAVERWRFVPARHGDEPMDSSVLVPLQFSLDS